MNIVLIGYRCTGKTTVGTLLAAATGMGFVDIDRLITDREGLSIPSIVSRSGWEHFRSLERHLVIETGMKDNLVVATGGGVVMDTENIARLREHGTLFWLKARSVTIAKRMLRHSLEGCHRPSLTGCGSLEEIDRLLTVRSPLYEQACDYEVDGDRSEPREMAAEILALLGEERRRPVGTQPSATAG